MTITFILGNGLSIGFDPELTLGRITERVTALLGGTYTDALERLARLASHEHADDLAPDHRGNFERLAGPLDRLAGALVALEPLLGDDAEIIQGLRSAALELRRHYLTIVGTVLAEIDARCAGIAGREASWARIFEFASALIRVHAAFSRTSIFTLNYDSLLMSAMLERAPYVYDGFRYGTLNEPFSQWGEPLLFHLHGSISWIRQPDGAIRKRRMEDVRALRTIQRWAGGDGSEGLPVVVLGDLKTPQVERHPVRQFYIELQRRLADSQYVVCGGYGFGDVPLNRVLSVFLSLNAANRVIIWSPTEPPWERLVSRLTAAGRPFEQVRAQLEWQQVSLPDNAPVDALRARLGAP